ncbi:zinc ribbon domain-containing protein [Candidatus Methylopumilus planktonicus]|uniref:zinc ribbon domain-containing protein n=1 Tax=Candidatus Methylopumilus planktonicus TaxID=1581557 RepID=UPI00111E7E5F|nr:zinc ribbon domain-containing protein [Candidatus Methylopumilus planktonicus]QDD01829.1 zinc ribbon domain-containing protein [Candidatus Methylopumilus planktonicus]
MICYECGHRIRRDFAKFCDHCGSSLEIKPKKANAKKEVAVKIEDEIDQSTNLFLLWNASITATFIFYIIHVMTDGYIYLFFLVLFMLAVSWMLLLTKLHDLSLRHQQPTKQFILTNFGVPILGTFYSYIKLTQK